MNSPTNILMIHPGKMKRSSTGLTMLDPMVSLAENLAEEAWVYVGEKGREEIEDLPSGVRLMGWSENVIEHFGALEVVIAIDDRDVAERISGLHPDVPVIHWSRGGSERYPLEQLECYNRTSPWLSVVEGMIFRSHVGEPRVEERASAKGRPLAAAI